MTNEAPAAEASSSGDYLKNVLAFGELILMAYQMSGQGLDPPIPPNFPKQYEILKNVIMDDYGTPTFYGFLVRLKQANTNNYVLVIRGTLGIKEWLIDLQSMGSIPFYNLGNVGSGFAETYESIYLWPIDPSLAAVDGVKPSFERQIADAIDVRTRAARENLPAPRLSLAGHSLGGALVTLYAVKRLVVSKIPVDNFYTFASPLVCDATFASAFDNLHLPAAYRIFNDWDPVPDLPPFSGYTPVGEGKLIVLSNAYYGWDPLCSHSMDTYMNYFDPAQPAAYACTHLIPAVAKPKPATVTEVTQGSTTTTITITIQTRNG